MAVRTLILGVFTLLLSIQSAHATLAGHNLILIHGLQPGTLSGQSLSQAQLDANGLAYFADFWTPKAEGFINWDTNERINGGIAVDVRNQVIALAQAGTCNSGCIFLTHSTGDLVARLLFDRQEAWLAPLGLQPLKVVASLDFAGAGGGTDLADIAFDLLDNPGIVGSAARAGVEAFLGVDAASTTTLGTVNDLRVSVARNTATAPNSVIRLRFVGGGDELFGLTKALISGTDDSVVPLHSACAASLPEAIDSCSNSIDLDGTFTASNGPSGLKFNHYPVLMGEDTSHGGLIDLQTGSRMTTVFNNFFISNSDLVVDFNTTVETGFFGRDFRFIPGARDTFVADVVFDTLDN